jgi:hypothetical protein
MSSAASPSIPARISDVAAIESVLSRYRAAFAALDVGAVKALWPTVNSKALGNAFSQLETQRFDFVCHLEVNGPRAAAACGGTAEFVPAVGNKNLRVEPRDWMFEFGRVGGTWVIDRVESR